MMYLLTTAGTTAGSICTGEFEPIWKFIGVLITIIKWGIPIILIILGTVDVGKAVVSGDDKKQKAAYGTFVKRLVAAVIVFIVPAIVGLVMGAFSKEGQTDALADCRSALGL